MKNTKKYERENGFTLVEAVVVTAMSAIVMLTLSGLFIYLYKNNSDNFTESSLIQKNTNALNDITISLRGADKITDASPSSITFIISNSTTTYSLNTDNLYKNENIIAESLINDFSNPVFSYFDNSGNAMTEPLNVDQISTIKVNLIARKEVQKSPFAFTLSRTVSLRLKN